MIVQMKKVSLIISGGEKESALKKLRRLGVLHIEEMQGSGPRLGELEETVALLDSGIYTVSDKKNRNTPQKEADTAEAVSAARRIAELSEEKRKCTASLAALRGECDRLKVWGNVDPAALSDLAGQGIELSLYEMPRKEFEGLGDSVTALILGRAKNTVRFVTVKESEDASSALMPYRVKLPDSSTEDMEKETERFGVRLAEIDGEITDLGAYALSMRRAAEELRKECELEVYSTGMTMEKLSEGSAPVSVAYFTGYVPAAELEGLMEAARSNSWGIVATDPTEEDDVPTKLENNRFVSLIYPLTDFLGTVPGYFEYDISAWFLGFILMFFGIIFGDGGYGLLICAVAGALILKSRLGGKAVPPTFLLVALLGGATVIWGALTCTWFGMAPESLPEWLRSISLPVISNVNADRIWHPFWTSGDVGLTTAQNVQIFCFALALVQLTVAHILGAVRNRRSLKILGDIGSVLQLMGMFYVVLSLVVNSQVFGLGLVIGGIPVGTVAIGLVAVGFVMSFIFANYSGSIKDSVLDSLKNIVSVLLGVVNVFSDIVSYIRLWAVGLAGAAISTTVNELASPFLGDMMFIAIAVVLLVFGHGLNMILNVLSVIVHGVRLNTLEFSTHLDMSWSGHKYKPFEE